MKRLLFLSLMVGTVTASPETLAQLLEISLRTKQQLKNKTLLKAVENQDEEAVKASLAQGARVTESATIRVPFYKHIAVKQTHSIEGGVYFERTGINTLTNTPLAHAHTKFWQEAEKQFHYAHEGNYRDKEYWDIQIQNDPEKLKLLQDCDARFCQWMKEYAHLLEGEIKIIKLLETSAANEQSKEKCTKIAANSTQDLKSFPPSVFWNILWPTGTFLKKQYGINVAKLLE